MPRTGHALALALSGLCVGLCPRLARAAPEASVEPPAPELDAAQAGGAEGDASGDGASEPEPEPAVDENATPQKPPRISGTYLGMTIWPALSWAFSPNLEIDQSAVLPGGGGAFRLGQAVFPWMTIGIDASGGFYFNENTFFTKGGLLIELGFYPVPRYPFSIRGGFGFGAGLIIDDRADEFGGVGGPRFMGSLRYEFFPQAERKRPKRPGGWVVGPELGWRGFTPANQGRPMSNTLLLGVWFGYYWGK